MVVSGLAELYSAAHKGNVRMKILLMRQIKIGVRHPDDMDLERLRLKFTGEDLSERGFVESGKCKQWHMATDLITQAHIKETG